MAAEASRAPIAVRERPVAPDIERPKLIVNSVTGALDALSCSAERLRVLLNSNIQDLNDLVTSESAAPIADRLSDVFCIFLVAAEKLDELEEVIAATTTKAYADSQAVAA